MRNELINVLTEYPDKTDIKKQSKEVFAEKKSVTRSEFYQAYTSGLEAKFVFELDPEDFASCDIVVDGKKYQPSHIEADGETFIITRTYQKDLSSIEVTVR